MKVKEYIVEMKKFLSEE